MMHPDSQERELREQVARIAIRAYRRGLVTGPGGNVSARIPGRNEVLVTATGLSLELTTVDNIVKVDLYGGRVDPTCPYRPSRETGFHCAIYRARPDVHAIVHVHPPYATAFSCHNKPLPMVTVTAREAGVKSVPCIGIAPAGTEKLRDLVEAAFSTDPTVRAILMCAHGIAAVGPTLESAYDIADLVEGSAHVAYLTATLGIPLDLSVESAMQAVAESRGGGCDWPIF